MEKYILSISYVNSRKELNCDVHGLYDSYEEAEEFANDEIEKIIEDYSEYYDDRNFVEEHFEFQYSIKKIIIKIYGRSST